MARPFWDLTQVFKKPTEEEIELSAEEQAAVDRLRGLRAMDLPAPGLDRRGREIHGMTVPEFTATNNEFGAIIRRSFPDQT